MEPKLQNLSPPLRFPSEVNRRGSILILALWAICFLSAFAVILGVEVRQKVSLVQRLDERSRLRFICGAGIQKAIAQVKKATAKPYDSFADTFASDSLAFKDVEMSDGRFSVGYYFHDDVSGEVNFRYSLIDEAGKININRAQPPILERLFRVVLGMDETAAQELAASIVDWRDADSELTIPLGSAEDSYYRNLQYPYEAKDGPFEVPEEVLLVKGMDEDSFNRLKGYITIYGDGKINVNTAPKPVLLALGLSRDIVEKIISYRYGKDNVLDTADDNVFDTPPNIIAKLSQFTSLSDSEVAQLSLAVDALVTNSGYFAVESVANINRRRYAARTVGVIDRKGKIMHWREY